MVQEIAKVVPFDPNEGATTFKVPSLDSIGNGFGKAIAINAESYAAAFESAFSSKSQTPGDFINEAISKGLAAVPGMLSFARISFMPDDYDSNLLQKPGIAFESIGKMARENLAPQLIIGMRIDDVIRYSTLSTHPWRPGWQIETKEVKTKRSPDELKSIKEAEKFLMNSNNETTSATVRQRDALGLTNFQVFLSGVTRDSLTYDQIAVWTDMDKQDRVKEYSQAPASQIRLVNPLTGFQGDMTIFAVAVDEMNKPKMTFTRDQLVLYRRNIRSAVESAGYGWSELEIGARLIQGFQNALDMNIDTFSRSSIPNGILIMSGETVTQKQLDLLNRMWTNLKRGITKAWALPVIGMAGKDSKLEILKLNDIKGMEVFYQDFMNMIIGAFATIYRFPVRRLGYRISGKGKDTEPLPDAAVELIDDDDPGLAPLLIHLENVINEYLIWTRWPDLRFRFNGKNPKEDARSFEAKQLARTYAEERQDAGLPPLEDTVDGEDLKELAKAMALAPADPAKQGVYQSLAVAMLTDAGEGSEGEEGGSQVKKPGARMGRKKDPARSEKHGGTSGVRRNSRAEKESSGEK